MSISAVGSIPIAQTQSSVSSQNARAADGDYKAPGAGRSKVKDADGDYKPTSVSTQSTSSSAVQAAVTGLKLGG